MQEWMNKNGLSDSKAFLDYANSLVEYYGQAVGALSCQMYEAVAAAQGVAVRSAEMADLPKYGEVAKAVNGAKKQSEKLVPSAVGRMVKQVGADTTLKNAKRDGAQFAWIPSGDTCAFCLMLASRGWQYMSEKTLRHGHAEHIHANCDCQYAVRFDRKSTVQGYDPDKYLDMYNNAEGETWEEKINSMRRTLSANKRQILSDDIVNLCDEYIPKSVGAKFKNYDIMDLQTGEKYHFAEGSKLQDKEVFAGKGCEKEYRKAEKYAEKYGGNTEDWQHVKGKAVLTTSEGDFPAEVHWSQCEKIGKVDFFLKRWLDDEG